MSTLAAAHAPTFPVFGVGTGSFRGLYREVSDNDAITALHYALQNGVPLIDTAPWYGAFQAEAIVGKALATQPRDSYLLSTKACLWSENGQAKHAYRHDDVLWSFENSLKRLGVEYVDMLHIHDPLDSAYQQILDETYPAYLELKAQGRIRAIGIGTGSLAIAQKLAAVIPFDGIMIAGRYTLLNHSALTWFNELVQRGTAVWSAGIYSTGILVTGSQGLAKFNYGDAPAEIMERVRQIEAVCAEYRIPLRAAAAQFVRAHPAIKTIIFGIESAIQVSENLAAFAIPIPAEFWHVLKSRNLIHPDSPTPNPNP